MCLHRRSCGRIKYQYTTRVMWQEKHEMMPGWQKWEKLVWIDKPWLAQHTHASINITYTLLSLGKQKKILRRLQFGGKYGTEIVWPGSRPVKNYLMRTCKEAVGVWGQLHNRVPTGCLLCLSVSGPLPQAQVLASCTPTRGKAGNTLPQGGTK